MSSNFSIKKLLFQLCPLDGAIAIVSYFVLPAKFKPDLLWHPHCPNMSLSKKRKVDAECSKKNGHPPYGSEWESCMFGVFPACCSVEKNITSIATM